MPRPPLPGRVIHAAFLLGLSLATPAPASDSLPPAVTSIGQVDVSRMAGGLVEPWGLAFLPDGRFLVTERGGVLSLYPPQGGAPVARFDDFPGLVVKGQGGLLDVAVPRDFAQSREILVTYAKRQGRGEGTALAALRLSADGTAVEAVRPLFEAAPGSIGGRHFGSRIVEAPDGTLFVTLGDRGADRLAQDMTRHEGAVVHLTRDGLPATPGVLGADALPDLYSKGHRNPQGATLDSEGRLWVVEHGARGGDELNLVLPGRNYGWPEISFGVNYDGSAIGTGTEAPGLEQPVHYWDPSIAPSGLMIYSGAMFPEWQGDVFIGSLKFDLISRLDPAQGYAEEQIQTAPTGRVRDIRQGPDGAIWFLSVEDGAVYRLSRQAPAG